MRRLTVVLLILLFGNNIYAQKKLADSVQNLLRQKLPDTSRAFSMIYYAMYTEQIDMPKAHQLYKEALNFALNKQLYYYAGMALRYEVTPYEIEGKKKLQLKNIITAIHYLKKDNTIKAKKELGYAMGDLASYYKRIDQYDDAVKYYLEGISILEKIDKVNMTIIYANLAAVFQSLNLPEKQKIYTDRALIAAKKSKKNSSLYIAYLYQVHYQIEVKNFNKAKKYLDSAKQYFNSTSEFTAINNFYMFSGITFQQLKQADSAIYYYNYAYQHAKKFNAVWSMSEPSLQIGQIYYDQEKYVQAETFAKEGLQIAEKNNFKVFMQEGYGLLGDIYGKTNRYKQAYEMMEKFIELKDDLTAIEKKKTVLGLEKKYETEKKDSQLKLQQATIHQKNMLNYILIGSALVLLFIIILIYRNYQHKKNLQLQRITELETEKQLTATEAVLKGEEQERTRLAKDLHDGLGGMLSGLKHSFGTMKGNLIMTPDNALAFNRSMDMLDSSIKEMRRVAHNMMPEALVKFGLDTALKDFCTDINLTGALQVDYQSIGMENVNLANTTAITIFRIVQELLNNTMKHAEANTAIVQLAKSDETITVTVEDNGKGFNPDLLAETHGIGWANIKNRVDFLKGKIDVKSEPHQGTSVLIEFKA